jgi:uncharacterized caspase-like protein
MSTDRQLQGAIFKVDGTSYLVLQDNRWDSEQIKVRSIDADRKLTSMPRSVIRQLVASGGQQPS